MDAGSRFFVLTKLNRALEHIADGQSLHESLYVAYRDDLQWLEDLDDLPPELSKLLNDLAGAQTANSLENRVRRTGARLSTLPEAALSSIVSRLIAFRNSFQHSSRSAG